ncbi:histidine kinase [Luteimonas sp. S4-F44]|uniref:sensor histidine kinase n=1 Tax=Luteimonas sp. S4-F44 TaxID=2925842 RepID=UPI001F538059|nr:histidine kinase [Luteimonas sp. S4-F44]UNK44206.1 histidine kinase [Luteimonas sp. S4-F44]
MSSWGVATVSVRRSAPPAASGHRSAVPEVTFCAPPIAAAGADLQHGAMTQPRRLFEPLNLAALLTLGAVAYSVRYYEPGRQATAWLLLGLFAVGFLSLSLWPPRLRRVKHAVVALLPIIALALIALAPKPGTAPILLVVWIAAAFSHWPPRAATVALVLADVVYYLILKHIAGFGAPLMVVLIFAGFQAFAGLCMHYARSAERTRDTLSRVNADLLATRALLADSARDAERLRVARELHDVAGHKLTAMRLNLRALVDEPALADNPQLRVAEQLSGELLADIRNVVQALRERGGLDLATALRALAAPMPRPVLRLSIADDVQVTDPAIAEAVLRLVQEALTNAAKHADADTLDVALHRADGVLHVTIEDDGLVREDWREGNGIAGMRERLVALQGRVRLARNAHGGMRIDAELPA